MPVNLVQAIASFGQEDVILASDAGLLSRRALTIDPDKIQTGPNGEKVIRPGLVLYKIAGATLHRVGLRTTLAAAATASSTTSLTLAEFGKIYQSKAAQYFAPGDVLKVLRPYGTITLALTWDTDDTVTVVVAGRSVTYTPGSATLATAATNLAAAINANPAHSELVTAIAAGAVVYLFSKTRDAYSLSVSETTTGDGTATASGATLVGNVTIGTIDTAGVNVTAGTVTLAAASAVTLPIGAPIGVEGEPWGLIFNAHNAAKFDNDIAGFNGAAVYGDRLPYWDGDIAKALNQIYFV